MKIDFISSSLTGGGAERVMVLLANFFVIKGHEVSIITFNDGDDFKIDNRVKRVRLHFGRIKNHTLRSICNLFFFYKKKRNRPDFSISFLSRTNFISIISCKIFSIKTIVSEHSNHLRVGDKIRWFTWNCLYKYADVVTVLTNFDKLFFEKKGAKVVVVPNPTSFEALKDNSHPRKKHILAIGDLNRYYGKGFESLIVLISPILKKHPDWILKIVGGGEYGLAFLKDLAIQEGVEQQIIFTGFRNDVNTLMQESEIFVLSSRYEGLPMGLIEAMSQGMACIAYDCVTGPSELINHNYNGLLMQNQNIKAMQNGLIRLIDNERLRKKLSQNAIKSLDRYSIDNIYNRWGKIFQEIL